MRRSPRCAANCCPASPKNLPSSPKARWKKCAGFKPRLNNSPLKLPPQHLWRPDGGSIPAPPERGGIQSCFAQAGAKDGEKIRGTRRPRRAWEKRGSASEIIFTQRHKDARAESPKDNSPGQSESASAALGKSFHQKLLSPVRATQRLQHSSFVGACGRSGGVS